MRAFEFLIENEEKQPEAEYGYSDTAEIRAAVFPLLQENIDKLNKKALQLGVPPIQLVKQNEHYKDVKDEDGSKKKELYYTVKVEGKPPRLEGYKFLATISHEGGGNVIKTVPGEDSNPQIKNFYDARPDYCDHCKKRRNRIDTFIVSDLDGNLRQVGRNCLADFLGGADPKAVLFYFSLRDSIQSAISEASERGSGSRGEYAAFKSEVMNIAAALVRKYGYRKRQPDSWGSTGQLVYWVLFADKRKMDDSDRELLDAARDIRPEDVKFAQEAIDWLNNLPQEEKDGSTFLHNLDVIFKSDDISAKNIGMAVALLPTYQRALSVKQQSDENSKKSNEWVGQVGAKITNVKVKVIGSQYITSQYGTSQLVTMQDEDGNILKWFNSSKNEMENGKEYTIKSATVKNHEDYKGRKQTLLKLVKT